MLMNKEAIKHDLINKLKKEHRFWSYNQDSIKDVPDDILIEMVMLYLDIDEINLLFKIYPYKQIRKSWIENLIPQGERLYTLNKFFAWYYFGMKKPGAYVRSIATRQLNRRLI